MVAHEYRKKERLQIMKDMWEKAKNPSKEKMYKVLSFEWGVSWRTYNDYCKILNIE